MFPEPELVDSTGVLSYTIKVEFIVKVKVAEFFDRQARSLSYLQKMRAIHEEMIQYLRRFGVEVNEYRSYEADLQAWTVERGSAVSVDDVSDVDYGSEEWGFFEVKLASPVLPYYRLSMFEVERVLLLIKDEYTTIINKSCTLTVHVGHIEDEPYLETYESYGFCLPAVQTLLQLLWKYEAQINAIHPEHRIQGNPRSLPPSKMLEYMLSRTIMERICDCRDMKALHQLWEGGLSSEQIRQRVAAYSIRGLTSIPGSDIHTGTIRFGQHQATLEFDDIKNWVWFVGSLVQLAVERGPCGIPLSLMGLGGYTRQVPLSEVSAIHFIKKIAKKDQYLFYKEQLGDYYYFDDPDDF
ncbi:uncharacterized protein CIMG_03502 [Coccidioides immitis RS]|uniref:Uncharacterized protein n=3 Tax=Coccidioides immitis TaxID=5501 RepID=J3KBI1_COCIM|nr:uncharacterized protein CIMG_03502 [Coccidioides immitis RS]EAS32478.3 hypothetical protein CIMG_03502 [Coccidioides immitis RS]KMP07714.1 hypothetical protein CIRG_07395 [Coccidioides immitis RMSCC 2394]KMU71833.1 hypothetical protein CISG_00143 [Coccidioides immitis RMSCC 3703]TPX25272.1 hypothetical protein DIZ76_010723 [Coccidioides immitis]